MDAYFTCSGKYSLDIVYFKFCIFISGGKEMLCKIQQLNKGDIFVSFLLKTFSSYLLYDLNDAINFTPPPPPLHKIIPNKEYLVHLRVHNMKDYR